jgi:trehalose 6-phosphate synthase/phosphatase
MRGDAEWETCAPATDSSWKQIVEPVMKTYTETTDGSTIENKETAIVWCYEDADPDFGSCQAKELHDHLESVLSNEPVSVKADVNHVEVKPQVSWPTQILVVFAFLTSVSVTAIGN